MKNEFTSSDIIKALKIPRPRFRQWIDMGFIVPSVQKSESPGIKHLFDRVDVYAIALFRHLTEEVDISRKKAALWVRQWHADQRLMMDVAFTNIEDESHLVIIAEQIQNAHRDGALRNAASKVLHLTGRERKSGLKKVSNYVKDMQAHYGGPGGREPGENWYIREWPYAAFVHAEKPYTVPGTPALFSQKDSPTVYILAELGSILYVNMQKIAQQVDMALNR